MGGKKRGGEDLVDVEEGRHYLFRLFVPFHRSEELNMKRKAGAGSGPTAAHTTKPGSRQASLVSKKQRRPELESDSEGGSDFDDDEDLLAAAQNGTATMSDEDSEGGFEDLEGEDGVSGGEDDEAGFEMLETSEDEDNDGGQQRPQGNTIRNGKPKESLYALPTTEEMDELQKTSEQFKSNMLKLQVGTAVSASAHTNPHS